MRQAMRDDYAHGTGASAIQFVPEIARVAGHVTVYQRSAPYVLPKADRPYRDAEHALYDRLPVVRKIDRLRIFLYGELLTSGFVLSPKLLAAPMQLWRRQLRSQIADPELRARCVPDYVMGCKRVVFSNDWYPALARPDTELVTERIERIVPDGVMTADGTTRVADVIIYGTGFKAGEFLAPMLVSGLGGWRLQQAWQDGPRSYLGIALSGFPNFFMLYGPNTNLGGNSIIPAAAAHHGHRADDSRAARRGGVLRGTGFPPDGDPLSRRRLLPGLRAHGPVVGGAPERPDGLPGCLARIPPGT
jgi:cation diffusion facilitator CzcD-associated flavoprotein CzcO